jgi:RNA polymerase sigma factor (TIGR02999 family)
MMEPRDTYTATFSRVGPEKKGSVTPGPASITLAPKTSAGEITCLLQSIAQGDAQAADRLLPLVYAQLRQLAAMRMAREPAGQTLQATALVHEAWLRLGGERQPDWQSQAQFFSAAAEAMRRILIDRARRRLTQRRGGRRERINVDDVELAAATDDARVLAVNEALERFAIDQPQKAELVKLRYFAGLTLEEAARSLDVSLATANRWWAYARAWLIQEMKQDKT